MTLNLSSDGAEERLGIIFGEILVHLEALEKYCEGITLQDFAENIMLQDAILMRLQQIGGILKLFTGTSKKTDPFGFLEKYEDIGWREFKGMRDIIAHNYCSVELSYPWEKLKVDIPKITKMIETICEDYPKIKQAAEIYYKNIAFKKNSDKERFIRANLYEDDEDEDNTPLP